MSLAATSKRGARLKARFAVNGIHSSSSDGICVGVETGVSVAVWVGDMEVNRPRKEARRRRGSRDLRVVQWVGVESVRNMAQGERVSEDDLSNTPPPPLDEVQQRLDEIQARKRSRINWRLTPHTAELALRAIDDEPRGRRPSSKARRRKRRKRLL